MEIHELAFAQPTPFEEIPGLSSRDVHESLKRLVTHGFVAGSSDVPIESATWWKLRVTASGWIMLGEWPDLDRVASAASIHGLLDALADEAPEEKRGALKRAAGVISRTADEVVRGTAADIARTIGREAADG